MKVDAATTNRGGGRAGLADRTGKEKGGHAKYECPLCKVTAPDIKSMQIHHDARHPKLPFDEASLVNLHASMVAETSKAKPGVRGSLKKWKVVIVNLLLNKCFKSCYDDGDGFVLLSHVFLLLLMGFFSFSPFCFVNVLYCDFNAMMLLSVFIFINIMMVIMVMLWSF